MEVIETESRHSYQKSALVAPSSVKNYYLLCCNYEIVAEEKIKWHDGLFGFYQPNLPTSAIQIARILRGRCRRLVHTTCWSLMCRSVNEIATPSTNTFSVTNES